MDKYDLILSHNPCDIFEYYAVQEIHGLNIKDCKEYKNTSEDSYICGWCNYIPKPDGNYMSGDRMFLFINLNRCTNELDLITTLYHELMHYAFAYYDWNIDYEEEIITLAELETKRVYQIIKKGSGEL